MKLTLVQCKRIQAQFPLHGVVGVVPLKNVDESNFAFVINSINPNYKVTLGASTEEVLPYLAL